MQIYYPIPRLGQLSTGAVWVQITKVTRCPTLDVVVEGCRVVDHRGEVRGGDRMWRGGMSCGGRWQVGKRSGGVGGGGMKIGLLYKFTPQSSGL